MSNNKSKILILSWRDPLSKLAGGAEAITEKYAEYWASIGFDVTWLTNRYFGCKGEEKRAGVVYQRIGKPLDGTVLGYLMYYPFFFLQTVSKANAIIKNKQVDIVIDIIHGLPFYTPLYSRARNFLAVFEIAGPIWERMFPWPCSTIGFALEKLSYRIYRHTEKWANSINTKNDILKIDPKAQVKIWQNAIDYPQSYDQIVLLPKFETPTAVVVSRLVKMKGVEVALHACKAIVAKMPTFRLFLIGSGEASYLKEIGALIRSLGIEKQVMLLGYVSENEKYEYLRRSHFLFCPSYKEGFGLVVVEAGIVGTPAIVRTGSAMDELIDEGRNGFKFAEDADIENLFMNNWSGEQYHLLSCNAQEFAQKRTWDKVMSNSFEETGVVRLSIPTTVDNT